MRVSAPFKSQNIRQNDKMAKKFTLQDKEALLKQGKPFVVHPKEAAKVFKGYDTSPEVLLACIVISGTLDTAEVLRAEMSLNMKIQMTEAQQRAHEAFRRVWATPTEDERAAVLEMAEKLTAASRSRKPLVWKTPTP